MVFKVITSKWLDEELRLLQIQHHDIPSSDPKCLEWKSRSRPRKFIRTVLNEINKGLKTVGDYLSCKKICLAP